MPCNLAFPFFTKKTLKKIQKTFGEALELSEIDLNYNRIDISSVQGKDLNRIQPLTVLAHVERNVRTGKVVLVLGE